MRGGIPRTAEPQNRGTWVQQFRSSAVQLNGDVQIK
jgi:hypothetical protein